MTRPSFDPVTWDDGAVRFLDQTLLPREERCVTTRDYRDVIDAIRRLAIRGAPLLGIAGAYAVALARGAGEDVAAAAESIASARPTAVNLRWGVERALAAPDTLAEARRIHEDQIAADAAMGGLGAALLPANATVLTHCNTGTLATGGIGSALGVIKSAYAQGRVQRVIADETRPLLQGARLTAWELARDGIPYDVIADGTAAGIIARSGIDAILVGADRIAASGDTANKVGTYGLALAAAAHTIPFYVVAPVSTIDPATPSGAAIDVEQRDADEVLAFAGSTISPRGATALNPAFDITPVHLITAIVTERGVLRPPFPASIASVLPQAVAR